MLVSAAITEGTPRELVWLWRAGRFELIVNGTLLRELEAVLLREKLRPYLAMDDALGFVVLLHDLAERGAMPGREVPRYTEDPDDDYLVELAISSGASYLVSGDRHLLALGEIPVEGGSAVRVLTPREFLDQLR